ncbi:MAG: Unknown protein [uncultured Thiotrichaceae bacterium]|uniref:Rad50/SbcC-type AAA domain-containing protein n=1 Tax=uncultured Thiotrichaceae bacterium TaxID=298394 RepID=A0A6S6SK53_9GAMM|nr:MAG: Unknown protein [uncultured Thiotrichaceae bacterium]
MIINALTAENFRKYKKLELRDIPERGLITVSGSNESGKTSIADALSFALFGRTYLTDEDNAGKLIHWGAKSASVMLTFTKDQDTYQLIRIINENGSVDAQLFNENKADMIADTPKEAEEKLKEILGYGYPTFSDSFYLVQRELSTPNPDSESIKDMVGISEYSRVSNGFLRDNERDNQALLDLRPKYEEIYHELKTLNIDDTWLPELVDARETLETTQETGGSLANNLQNASDSYATNRSYYLKAKGRYGFVRVISDILLALLIASLMAWGVMVFLPEETEALTSPDAWFDYQVFKTWSEEWMSLFSAGLAILFFIGMVWSWRIEDQELQPLRQTANAFADNLMDGQRIITADIESMVPVRCASYLDARGQGIKMLLGDDEGNQDKLETLSEDIKTYTAENERVVLSAKALHIRLKDQGRDINYRNTELNQEIDLEIARTAEAAQLKRTLDGFDQSMQEHSMNIKVQTTGVELLRRSAKDLTEQFNQSVSKTSARILPYFTNQHYKNVKIDEQLNVAVFSEEKNDFMDFDEISSGTQRQIMLALRIAMSEELAKNNDNEHQFIILDEPFAFFDHERTVTTLEQLPNISEIISQVWVVSQEFPEGTQDDKVIACAQGQDVFES